MTIPDPSSFSIRSDSRQAFNRKTFFNFTGGHNQQFRPYVGISIF